MLNYDVHHDTDSSPWHMANLQRAQEVLSDIDGEREQELVSEQRYTHTLS